MHTSYDIMLGHPADFKVRYRFYTPQEGGRSATPFQGYRSDFWYEHSTHTGTNQLFMIWPEFEDNHGMLLMDNTVHVALEGTARMWVIVPERRDYHLDKIKPGTTGYFKEGGRSVAICTVTEIIGLATNPRETKK